jgi:hypothetical protein
MDSERFHLPFEWAVQVNFDMSDARGKELPLLINLKAALWIGEAIVAVDPTEARKAWLFACLTPPKEGFEGEIDTHSHILQDLGMYAIQRGALFFQYQIGGLLLIAGQTPTLLLIRILAALKQVVVEPTAFIQYVVELRFLFPGWEYPVQKHFTHISIINLNCSVVKSVSPVGGAA